MIVELVLLLLAGLAAGMIAGLFGLGGGVIFAPVLLFLYQNGNVQDPVLWTIGTSLLCNFTAALSSSYGHFKNNNFYIRESISIGLTGVVGTFIGRFVSMSPWYSEREFRIFFSVILFHSVYHFFKRKKRPEGQMHTEKKLTLLLALGIGLSAGILANLAGVGGGLILVPAMSVVLCFPFRKAISISSTAIVVITLSGWLQLAAMNPMTSGYSGFHVGYVDVGIALPLILGSFFGARFGVRLVDVLSMRLLEIVFASLILFFALRMLYGLW